MSSIPQQALRWPVLALVGLLCLTTLAPTAALADTNLDIGGTAVISYANGDSVRLRDTPSYDGKVLAQIPEGTVVDVLDGPITDTAGHPWFAISIDGPDGAPLKGFAVSYFLARNEAATTSDPPESGTSVEVSTGDTTTSDPEALTAAEALEMGVGAQTVEAAAVGTAVISGTNGDGVRCRASAGYDGAVITVLAQGTAISLTGSLVGEWQPINCGGRSGFVHRDFVSYGGSDDSGSDGGTDTGGAVSGYATVAGTNGGGLRCRSAASYDASVITVLGEGTQVALRGGVQGEWQPIVCAGTNGFGYAAFLSSGGGSTDDGATDGGTDNGGAVSGYANVSGSGGGLRCRSAGDYSASVIVVLAEGSQVALRGAQQGEWQPVVCSGTNGFVYASYLSTGGTGTTPEPDPSDGGNGGGLWVGAHAVTSSSLNLRYDASMSAGVAAIAPAGTVVAITGGLTNGFYAVDWDGLSGYMYGDYLSYTDAALSERGGSSDDVSPSPGAGTGTGSGSAIASFALQYVGYPYVWATAGPASFDCSGFTYWVALNVVGIDIGRGLFTQEVAGTPVSYSNLQPGDLVFFQNTYTWGLSHAGIYIGNNQFVHAENETTGVKISDITSQYYSSRWYGAVRLT